MKRVEVFCSDCKTKSSISEVFTQATIHQRVEGIDEYGEPILADVDFQEGQSSHFVCNNCATPVTYPSGIKVASHELAEFLEDSSKFVPEDHLAIIDDGLEALGTAMRTARDEAMAKQYGTAIELLTNIGKSISEPAQKRIKEIEDEINADLEMEKCVREALQSEAYNLDEIANWSP